MVSCQAIQMVLSPKAVFNVWVVGGGAEVDYQVAGICGYKNTSSVAHTKHRKEAGYSSPVDQKYHVNLQKVRVVFVFRLSAGSCARYSVSTGS